MTQIAVPSSGRAGQSTMTEQARELANVHAMMTMAQQFPRNEQLALSRMTDACGMIKLAEKAFYRYPRADGMVNGPSIHLARELARCWGNIEHGIKELDRDDVLGRSEMLARAWDIETNTVSSNAFIVPHKRDTKQGIKELVDMRDIYENNANAGARRLREAIFAVLPVWFRQGAIELCLETLEHGDDKDKMAVPMVDRKARYIREFVDNFRVTLAMLEEKLGVPEGRWTAAHLATLSVVYKSLKAGETTVDMEFEREQVHAKDITPPPAPPIEPEPEQPQTPIVPAALLSQIATQLTALQIADRGEAMTTLGLLAGREHTPERLHDLTHAEAVAVNNRLADILNDEHPGHALDAVLDAIRNGDEIIATDPVAQDQK